MYNLMFEMYIHLTLLPIKQILTERFCWNESLHNLIILRVLLTRVSIR